MEDEFKLEEKKNADLDMHVLLPFVLGLHALT